MTKRRTIGTNPLDEIIPNPLESTVPYQEQKREKVFQLKKQSKKQNRGRSSGGDHSSSTPDFPVKNYAERKAVETLVHGSSGKPKTRQEERGQAVHPAVEVLPPSGQLAERLSGLEQENLCLKVALGLILAPIVLLAFFG